MTYGTHPTATSHRLDCRPIRHLAIVDDGPDLSRGDTVSDGVVCQLIILKSGDGKQAPMRPAPRRSGADYPVSCLGQVDLCQKARGHPQLRRLLKGMGDADQQWFTEGGTEDRQIHRQSVDRAHRYGDMWIPRHSSR